MPLPTPGPRWLEDFAVGQVVTTQGRTVTDADLVAFAGLTWDANPVHTDAAFAAEGRFGEVIGHGLLGMSYAMGLVARTGVFEGSSVALLGVDDWRFHAPIRVGDTLHVRVEIVGVRTTSSGQGVLDRAFSVLNQHGDLVQSGRIGLMVAPRPSGVGTA